MDDIYFPADRGEFRKELEAELDEYVNGWKDEELFALFTECTTYLSATKNRIRALEQQGALKRVMGFFSGKNRKLKIDILKKTNHVSMILFEIVRILTSRITMVDSRVDELFEDNIRIHNEILMLQKAQRRYDCKLEEHDARIRLIERFSLGTRRYAGLTGGEKILSVVSDIFNITNGNWEIDTGELETVLFDRLELPDHMEAKEFYNFLIEDPAELSLYMKDGCKFDDDGNVSEYGKIILNIDRFYNENPLLICQANKRRVSPAELCMQEFNENWSGGIPENLDILTVCESLLYDMEIASYIYEEPESLDLEKECSEEDLDKPELEEKKGKKKRMIVFSPEKLQVFSKEGEEESYFEDAGRHNLLLPDMENMLKEKMDMMPEAESVIVVPSQYLSGGNDYFSGGRVDGACSFVSRADYYMYLWHAKFARDTRRKLVIIIEEYGKKLWAQAYHVKEDRYEKQAVAKDISWLRNGKHLLMDLEEKNFFESERKEEAAFIIISDHKDKEEKKLSKKGMQIIRKDSSWEDKWKDGQNFDVKIDELLKCSTVYEFCNEERRFITRRDILPESAWKQAESFGICAGNT